MDIRKNTGGVKLMRIYDKEQFNKENIFGLGNANTAYAQ